jgi:hypothetical protein
MDGPVVKAAQAALETGDVNLVLVWVHAEYDAEIKAAFKKTLDVRKAGPEARSVADTYFFETLVRLHRQGEGAPFTGLKPAGRDLGPAIPAADKALETGDVEPLVKLVTGEVESGLRRHFQDAARRSRYEKSDVAAGRDYVRAYVEYIHFAQRLHLAAATPAPGHEEEGEAAAPHHD